MRVFLGIDLPSDLKKSLSDLKNKVSLPEGLKIKWVEEPNFHVTLTFYGEISQNLLTKLIYLVENITQKFSTFKISLNTLGFFPERGSPRVVWIGIDQGKDRLYELFDRLKEGYRKIKLKFEDRFHPHITLFRIKSMEREKGFEEYFLKLSKEVERLKGVSFVVNSVKFFESILTSEGPIYKILKELKFKDERN